MKLSQLYKELKDALGNDLEARMILEDCANISWSDIMTSPDKDINDSEIQAVLKRRINGEPLSRIAGKQEFYGLEFMLGKDTLDPRPDTETLIDAALNIYKERGTTPKTILDLGTGTGCIPITLLKHFPNANATAVDLAQGALDIAKQNAQHNGVIDRISFIQSDWWENITGTYDLIVSNPPYIPHSDIANLDIEVQKHDPILALDGGKDGYDCYEIIFSQLKKHLNPDGVALFEIGINQCGYISRLVDKYGIRMIYTYPDLAGILRVVEISCGDK